MHLGSYLEHLEHNFAVYVDAYRARKTRQLANERHKVEQERTRLQHLIDGIHSGLISDDSVHVQFLHARLRVLQELLGTTRVSASTEVHSLTRTQLAQAYRSCQYLYTDTGILSDAHGFAHRILNTLHTTDGKRVTNIRTHVAFTNGQPVRAYFNNHNARLSSSTVRTYTLTATPKGAALVGLPPLTTSQRNTVLSSLAEHLRTHYS